MAFKVLEGEVRLVGVTSTPAGANQPVLISADIHHLSYASCALIAGVMRRGFGNLNGSLIALHLFYEKTYLRTTSVFQGILAHGNRKRS